MKSDAMPIDSSNEDGRPVNPVTELLRREIERRRPRSIEEANRIAAEVSQRYNRTSQRELGGMSPEQAYSLTQPGWMDKAVTLNDRLTLQDLSGSPLFQNARSLLLTVQELGAVKSTATGAFNRKFAARMFEEFAVAAPIREMTLRHNKVLNQNDVPFLELYRHLLPQAGLLLFRKGEFRLVKRTNTLLTESSAGDLFRLLFRTLFLRINLEALDRLPEAPQVQHTIGFSLYQMSRMAESWIELADIAPSLLLPTILRSLPVLSWSQDASLNYVRSRILRPLKDFGLIEYESDYPWNSPERVRKSGLFNQFIQFNLPPAIP